MACPHGWPSSHRHHTHVHTFTPSQGRGRAQHQHQAPACERILRWLQRTRSVAGCVGCMQYSISAS
jgi:hypothetical protein